MYVLGIDTATLAGSVAVLEDDRLLFEQTLYARTPHTERLLSALDDALRALSLSLGDLNGIAVGIGPGSFTGLRIGVTTAKSLAYSLRAPVVGIPTLDALAANCWGATTLICPLLDARKREVYAALYRNRDGRIERVSDYVVTAPDAMFHEVHEPVLLLGEGAAAYRSQLEAALGDRACFADAVHNTLRGSLIAQLGRQRLLRGDYDDAFTLAPLYVRKSDAELHWERRHQERSEA